MSPSLSSVPLTLSCLSPSLSPLSSYLLAIPSSSVCPLSLSVSFPHHLSPFPLTSTVSFTHSLSINQSLSHSLLFHLLSLSLPTLSLALFLLFPQYLILTFFLPSLPSHLSHSHFNSISSLSLSLPLFLSLFPPFALFLSLSVSVCLSLGRPQGRGPPLTWPPPSACHPERKPGSAPPKLP